MKIPTKMEIFWFLFLTLLGSLAFAGMIVKLYPIVEGNYVRE